MRPKDVKAVTVKWHLKPYRSGCCGCFGLDDCSLVIGDALMSGCPLLLTLEQSAVSSTAQEERLTINYFFAIFLICYWDAYLHHHS